MFKFRIVQCIIWSMTLERLDSNFNICEHPANNPLHCMLLKCNGSRQEFMH